MTELGQGRPTQSWPRSSGKLCAHLFATSFCHPAHYCSVGLKPKRTALSQTALSRSDNPIEMYDKALDIV